ncbi:MAG TPA: MFS transporter [Planctomycetaceae bacterium]|nr:MFS transporter [Planctomycetaceae bacterium]
MPADDIPEGLWRNRSFWGLNLTQFLGAFNDNLFKELVLLLCVEHLKEKGGSDLQGLASVLFAVPFIFLSGLAGHLADRHSKRTVLISCKIGEVLITLFGMAALASGRIDLPLAVLCLLGVHSAFFGPAKYGVLPEIVHPNDVGRANGLMLMITFLAIILGLATGGAAVRIGQELLHDQVWPVSFLCVIVAVAGWFAATKIQPLTPINPALRFRASDIFLTRDTVSLLWARRDLLGCLLASTTFWFAAGMVYPPAINRLGIDQLLIGPLWTGCLAASTGLGIAVGCAVAGKWSQGGKGGAIARIGVWGLAGCLAILAVPGPNLGQTLLGGIGSAAALVGVGFFAGLFSVPIQTYLLTQAPADQKGRIIAALNLINWTGLALSGVFYALADMVRKQFHQPPAMLFAYAAVVLLALAIVYRPPRFRGERGDVSPLGD